MSETKQNYLCMQRSQPGQSSQEKPSPAQMQEKFAAFQAWQTKFQDNIVDMGGKLGNGKRVTTEGATDGPFVESKELIGGYMILRATSLEEAIEIASGLPGLVSAGSCVDVFAIHSPS